MKHVISLQQAIDMTASYRFNIPEGMANAETFDKDAVLALLNQPDCTSLRIYYGEKNDKTIHAILVAADKNGNDLLQTTVLILEEGDRCPPFCPPQPSPLNS